MAATDADRRCSAGPASARLAASGRHHIVCRRCGAVARVDRVAGHAPCLEAAACTGFSVDEADVTFWGLCAACREARGPRSSSLPSPAGNGAGPRLSA